MLKTDPEDRVLHAIDQAKRLMLDREAISWLDKAIKEYGKFTHLKKPITEFNENEMLGGPHTKCSYFEGEWCLLYDGECISLDFCERRKRAMEMSESL